VNNLLLEGKLSMHLSEELIEDLLNKKILYGMLTEGLTLYDHQE